MTGTFYAYLPRPFGKKFTFAIDWVVYCFQLYFCPPHYLSHIFVTKTKRCQREFKLKKFYHSHTTFFFAISTFAWVEKLGSGLLHWNLFTKGKFIVCPVCNYTVHFLCSLQHYPLPQRSIALQTFDSLSYSYSSQSHSNKVLRGRG